MEHFSEEETQLEGGPRSLDVSGQLLCAYPKL